MLVVATMAPASAVAERRATATISVGVIVADCAVIAGADASLSGDRPACPIADRVRPQMQHCAGTGMSDCQPISDAPPATRNAFDQLYF